MPTTASYWSEPSSGLQWYDDAICALVPNKLAEINPSALWSKQGLWHRSPLDDQYDLVYCMTGAPVGAQPLSLFNLRRWIQSQPKGRILRVQRWNQRLEVAALDGTRIKSHAVQRADSAEDVAYFVLLAMDQMNWNGFEVPVFWEGLTDTAVRSLTEHFIAHWHVRSLTGILTAH